MKNVLKIMLFTMVFALSSTSTMADPDPEPPKKCDPYPECAIWKQPTNKVSKSVAVNNLNFWLNPTSNQLKSD